MNDSGNRKPAGPFTQTPLRTSSQPSRFLSGSATTPATTTGTPPRVAPAIRPAEANGAGSAARAKIYENLQKIEPGSREFAFTSQDFERVRALIHAHAGISLSPIKQDMVYSRLARRLRACGEARFSDYLDKLETNRNSREWEAFVNALTTNLTFFFRESHHFDVLRDFLRKASDGKRTFNIWCSAASSGEEAYSIAIAACEAFGSLNPPVKIIASDLDTQVLAHGERGVYGSDRTDRLSPDRLDKYFTREPGATGQWRVRSELRRLLTFRQLNLLERDWHLSGPFDAIFCRNVMIYFDKPTQHGILKRFVPLLRHDGLLFAGHSENFMHAAELFRSLGRTVYARADA